MELRQFHEKLEDEMHFKIDEIKSKDNSLAHKKVELKELEHIQRKKDINIEELEILAGRDRKVIKEVLIDKVRDSKVDEVMISMYELTRVPINKLSDNYYEFGTRKIYVKLQDPLAEFPIVLVRDRGGKYVEVSQFISEYEDEELQKLDKGETRYTLPSADEEGVMEALNLKIKSIFSTDSSNH